MGNIISLQIKKFAKHIRRDKEKNLIVIAIALFHFFLTYVNDIVIFIVQGNGNRIPYTEWYYILAKIIILFFLIYLYYVLIFAKIKFIKYFVVYFSLMLIVAIIVWPGIWRWDEMITLGSITDGGLYYWQHWLSSFYFLLCLELIPCAGGICIIQIAIISVIIGNIIYKCNNYFNSKWVNLIFVWVLMPAVIDNNFYPIRSSLSAYIEMYVIFEVLFETLKEEKINPIKNLFLGVLTALAASWRPENFIYIICIPVILLLKQKISLKNGISFIVISITLMFSISKIQNFGLSRSVELTSANVYVSDKEKYTLSGFIEPLGSLIKGEFRSNSPDKDLEVIDRAISVDLIRETSGLYAFWGNGIRDLSRENLAAIEKIYIKLVLYNAPKFLKERLDFFINTNAIKNSSSQFSYKSELIYEDYTFLKNYGTADMYEEFKKRYIYNKPVNSTLRKNFITLLEGKGINSSTGSSTLFNMTFYNIAPILFISILILFYEIRKKRSTIFLILIPTIWIRAGIVFLSAPATLFMYYFSTYLMGGILIILWILFTKNNNKIK